jgi:phage tail sheath gpL-like
MISFNTVPQNILTPLFYAEMDSTQAGYFTQNQRILLIGQKLATGTAPADVPVLVSRNDEAKGLFGLASMLTSMHKIVRLNDLIGEVWCLPIADPGAGVAAAGTVTFSGSPTEAGTYNLYIGDDRIQMAVAVSQTPAQLATALAAAINAETELPVTAVAAAAVVTVTLRHKGLVGNDLKLQSNYRGSAGGEITPAGMNAAIVQPTGGTGVPSLDAAIAALGDEEFDFVIHPFSDAASLDSLKLLMNDNAGRWSYSKQIYGHVYTAKRDTLVGLQNFGVTRNDQHHTIAGFENGVPSPLWEFAAAYGARNAVFIKADPARPTQTGVLQGILPAPASQRFIKTERETLLNAGIATNIVDAGGNVMIERAVTTYQRNSFGQKDPSYRDSETMHQLTTVVRRMRNRITTKYPRHKLADDGTVFGSGQAIITPKVARGEFIAEYKAMELEGLVENSKLFAKYLVVQRNANDPNRLDVLFPPDLVNQLRIFAVLVQFRLQYSE